MKAYKKIMQIVVRIENVVLALSMLLVLVLTFGNVIARKIFHHSWGFTEEITVAVFVLISMLAAGAAARNGELVQLSILQDAMGEKGKKVLHFLQMLVGVVYSLVLVYQGAGRMFTDGTYSPILHIAKSIFWAFIVVGGISLALHFVENFVEHNFREVTEEINEGEGEAA
ncbi:TRAP-type C4-dicarboxylate transport system, small permease component [Lachnospiraceae bacterium]|nr:TRAP-type C4-dicarboxylate transport system, small permease component [Lachnospiraceae bacterium]